MNTIISKTTFICNNHACVTGDTIILKANEDRWYVRMWYRITFRKCPLRSKVYTIKNIVDSQTMEIK